MVTLNFNYFEISDQAYLTEDAVDNFVSYCNNIDHDVYLDDNIQVLFYDEYIYNNLVGASSIRIELDTLVFGDIFPDLKFVDDLLEFDEWPTNFGKLEFARILSFTNNKPPEYEIEINDKDGYKEVTFIYNGDKKHKIICSEFKYYQDNKLIKIT
jgi:hypothetical protein